VAAPITLNSFYSIYGNGGSGPAQFSTNITTYIQVVNPNLNPVFHISGMKDIHLQNLLVFFALGGNGDGILIDGSSCCVTLDNVWTGRQGTFSGGTSLHIKGGSRYLITNGLYSGSGSSPSVLYESDEAQCGATGNLAMRDSVIAGNGIALNLTCGIAGPFAFENILSEDAPGAFLTINESTSAQAWGISLKQVDMSDEFGPPYPSLLENHGTGTDGVQVFNPGIQTNPATPIIAGDPVNDLEIWSPFEYPVGQTTNYVFHGPGGIITTMPTSSAATAIHR
ncbi:MAG: hypothetical protein WBS18_11055, partial [Candidatus Acidiferrales bacterium]